MVKIKHGYAIIYIVILSCTMPLLACLVYESGLTNFGGLSQEPNDGSANEPLNLNKSDFHVITNCVSVAVAFLARLVERNERHCELV